MLNHERPENAPKADPGMPSSHANSECVWMQVPQSLLLRSSAETLALHTLLPHRLELPVRLCSPVPGLPHPQCALGGRAGSCNAVPRLLQGAGALHEARHAASACTGGAPSHNTWVPLLACLQTWLRVCLGFHTWPQVRGSTLAAVVVTFVRVPSTHSIPHYALRVSPCHARCW